MIVLIVAATATSAARAAAIQTGAARTVPCGHARWRMHGWITPSEISARTNLPSAVTEGTATVRLASAGAKMVSAGALVSERSAPTAAVGMGGA